MEGSPPPAKTISKVVARYSIPYLRHESDIMGIILGMHGAIHTDIHVGGCSLETIKSKIDHYSYSFPRLAVNRKTWTSDVAKVVEKMAPACMHEDFMKYLVPAKGFEDKEDNSYIEFDFRTVDQGTLYMGAWIKVVPICIVDEGTRDENEDLMGAMGVYGRNMGGCNLTKEEMRGMTLLKLRINAEIRRI